jgi:uncharacterized protein (TIGR02246 family)
VSLASTTTAAHADADTAALADVVRRLEKALHDGDGAAFAADFADDADFVNVQGSHFRGRSAIAGGHAGIFATIYAGSVNQYTLESARLIRPDVAIAHVRARLEVPRGPLAGLHPALFSIVATREPDGWRIASFHNTLEAQMAPRS